MNFFLRLTLAGAVDPVELDDALARAVARHPLLTAIVARNGRKGLFWKSQPNFTPTVQWRVASPDDQQLSTSHIDLHQQPGLVVVGCQSASGAELLFQFHHSCCDAMGGLQVVEDMLLAYAHKMDQSADGALDQERSIAWRQIDAERLSDRAKFGLTRWQLLGKFKQQAVGLIGAWQFLNRTPARLVAAPSTAALPEHSRSFPTSCSTDLPATATQSLMAEARAAGTTLNNLLIRDLLRAIGDFRDSRHKGHEREWLRMSIPINLRRAADHQLSAANVVSMIFVDRQSNDLGDQRALLESIHEQMRQIKDLELGLTFPLSLRFFTSLPGASKRMQRMSSDTRCRCTTVLSNLMRPFDKTPLPRRDGKLLLGDCELTSVEFMPPIRQGTPAAFGVLTYADRLNITLHYDPNSLTSVDAEELLQGYVAYLLQSPAR